jgi:hypothetical protein
MRDARLQSIKTIIKWQQRVLAKRNNHCFLRSCENGRMRIARPHPSIFNGVTFAPFSHCFGVDVIEFGKTRYAFLTMLYYSTQCRSRAGAAV